MALSKARFLPGVVKDDSTGSAATEGVYTDADKVRFRKVGQMGLPQIIGGWEKASTEQFQGKARALHSWEDDDSNKWIAIGSNVKLYVYNDGEIWDITPIRATSTAASLGVTAGATTATITFTAHGASDGDIVHLHSPSSIGGVSLGSYGTVSGPFLAIEGSDVLITTITAHGLATGDFVTFSGSSSVNGIGSVEINAAHSVHVSSVDTFEFQTSSSSTATTTAAGGASVSYKFFDQYTVSGAASDSFSITTATATGTGSLAGVEAKFEVSPGLENSTASKGYGTGTYGSGYYSLPDSSSDFRARTWKLSNFVNELLANVAKDKLYRWSRVRSNRAYAVAATDIPTDITSHFVTPERHIVLLGCTDSGSNYDRMTVRWGTQANANTPTGGLGTNDWTPTATNTSRDFPLQEGTRLIRGLAMPFVSLLWTDTALYQMRYLGDPSLVYGFDLIGQGCGLIGPNAVARVGNGGQVFWLSSSRQFFGWQGDRPVIIPCPVRDFLFDELAPVQEDLIYAGVNGQWNEVWWFYPDSTNENAKYVAYNFVEGHWTVGTFDITAWLDRGVTDFPVAAHSDGYLYIHERGNTADGGALSWSFTTGLVDLDDGNNLYRINGLVCDIEDQIGGWDLTMRTVNYPRGGVTESDVGTIGPNTQKVDFRKTGRMVGFKMSGSSTPAQGRLGDAAFDILPTAQRR